MSKLMITACLVNVALMWFEFYMAARWEKRARNSADLLASVMDVMVNRLGKVETRRLLEEVHIGVQFRDDDKKEVDNL